MGNLIRRLMGADPNLERRDFLKALLGLLLTPAVICLGTPAAEDTLHILRRDDVERLRLDFNASRDKVRLLFMLSPT